MGDGRGAPGTARRAFLSAQVSITARMSASSCSAALPRVASETVMIEAIAASRVAPSQLRPIVIDARERQSHDVETP